MNKNTKTILAVALGAVALYLIFKPTNVKAGVPAPETITPPNLPIIPGSCPEGELPCANSPVGGTPKCYNPNASYLVNPCNGKPNGVNI